jgi:CDGSH-type Zn-finger protein
MDVKPHSEVELTYCPNGPLLVRGADVVTDADGSRHEVTRPVVAVCLCGKSSRKPWCDGTHKVITQSSAARRLC